MFICIALGYILKLKVIKSYGKRVPPGQAETILVVLAIRDHGEKYS